MRIDNSIVWANAAPLNPQLAAATTAAATTSCRATLAARPIPLFVLPFDPEKAPIEVGHLRLRDKSPALDVAGQNSLYTAVGGPTTTTCSAGAGQRDAGDPIDLGAYEGVPEEIVVSNLNDSTTATLPSPAACGMRLRPSPTAA